MANRNAILSYFVLNIYNLNITSRKKELRNSYYITILNRDTNTSKEHRTISKRD